MAGGVPADDRKMVDLRSDTVTRPTHAMLSAMMSAAVGDDVWGDDPTVNELQATVASMFGMEAALYCPSGTMTNQIAIKIHTQPGDELLCADSAHIYCYEAAGIAFNSGVQAKLLPSERGRISAAQVEAAINPDDAHFPPTTLVCLENTTNKGGGAVYSLQSLTAISRLCRSKGLRIHLDGARIFNAIITAGYTPADIGPLFDTVSICLSKGLGCPVGSLLLGSTALIARAKRVRKVLGGGMRQAGFLAAAGLYALQHHVDRLAKDHFLAKQLGAVLLDCPLVKHVLPVETNIVIFELHEEAEVDLLLAGLKAEGVLLTRMSHTLLRAVTHLDVDERAIEMLRKALVKCCRRNSYRICELDLAK